MAKSVLITGATSGIGWQLAQDYLQAGCHVIACGRNREKLELLQKQGSQILSFDVTSTEPLKQAIAQGEVTRVDTLILNAGVCEYVDQGAMSGALMQRTLDINVVAPVAILECLLPLLKKSSDPKVAIISSASVYLPFIRAEAYGASKAALRYLGQVLNNSLKPQGIHVATVILGFIDTPLTQKNDFSMPGLASAKQASTAIIKGLAGQKSQILFPFGFCLTLSLVEKLPVITKLWLARKLMKADTQESV